MEFILYDAGAVNVLEMDGPDRYPQHNLDEIAGRCEDFFGHYPDLNTIEVLEEIATADYDTIEEKYGGRTTFRLLSESLEKFFNGE